MENIEIIFNDNDFDESGLFSTCSYLNKDIKIAAYLNYFIYRFKPYY